MHFHFLNEVGKVAGSRTWEDWLKKLVGFVKRWMSMDRSKKLEKERFLVLVKWKLEFSIAYVNFSRKSEGNDQRPN